MKKILSILLALTLVLSLGIAAFAADTYTITMNTTKGHAYTAYQVFKGDLAETKNDDGNVTKKVLSNIEWGEGVDGDALLKALQDDENYGTAFTDCTDAASVAEVLGNYTSNSEVIKAIAKIIYDNKKGSGTSGNGKIEDLAAGYYLIVDTTEEMPDGQTYSDYMLEVVSDVEVNAKDGTTTSEKKVKDKNDTDG